MGLKRKLNIKMLTSIRVIIFALLGHVISIPFSSIGGFTTPGPGSGGLTSSSDYDYYNYDYDYSSGHVILSYPSWTTSYTPFESSTIYYYSSYTPTSSWQGDNGWYGSGYTTSYNNYGYTPEDLHGVMTVQFTLFNPYSNDYSAAGRNEDQSLRMKIFGLENEKMSDASGYGSGSDGSSADASESGSSADASGLGSSADASGSVSSADASG